MNVETVLEHYVIAAVWSSTDENGDPLDGTTDESRDIAPETYAQMREDVTAFCESVEEQGWDVSAITDEQMGHDFWLTRNRHGAGFWDRGLGQLGDDLTALAHPFGSVDLYVGDDGLIHG